MLGLQPQDQEESQGAQGKQLSYSTTKTQHVTQQSLGNCIPHSHLDEIRSHAVKTLDYCASTKLVYR